MESFPSTERSSRSRSHCFSTRQRAVEIFLLNSFLYFPVNTCEVIEIMNQHCSLMNWWKTRREWIRKEWKPLEKQSAKQFKFDDVIMWMGCSNYWHVQSDCCQPLDSVIILLTSILLWFNDSRIDPICFEATSLVNMIAFNVFLINFHDSKLFRLREEKTHFRVESTNMQILKGNNQSEISGGVFYGNFLERIVSRRFTTNQ